MGTVRQHHMPGNYEQYNPTSNRLGAVVCKDCWESSNKENTAPLNTVWVSVNGESRVWWLCPFHTEELKAGKSAEIQFLKSVQGVRINPGL